jgi:hypothetical protein
MNRKRCIECDKKKPLSDFSIGTTRGGRVYRFRKCKECRADLYRNKYRANPVKARKQALKNRDSRKIKNWNLRFAYGITVDQWDEMFQKQGKCCAICKRKSPVGRGWSTDHKGDKIRAILCSHCNTAIGLAQESITILKSMIRYLRKHAQ